MFGGFFCCQYTSIKKTSHLGSCLVTFHSSLTNQTTALGMYLVLIPKELVGSSLIDELKIDFKNTFSIECYAKLSCSGGHLGFFNKCYQYRLTCYSRIITDLHVISESLQIYMLFQNQYRFTCYSRIIVDLHVIPESVQINMLYMF
jgi:hypothetical protein